MLESIFIIFITVYFSYQVIASQLQFRFWNDFNINFIKLSYLLPLVILILSFLNFSSLINLDIFYFTTSGCLVLSSLVLRNATSENKKLKPIIFKLLIVYILVGLGLREYLSSISIFNLVLLNINFWKGNEWALFKRDSIKLLILYLVCFLANSGLELVALYFYIFYYCHFMNLIAASAYFKKEFKGNYAQV